MYIHSEKLLSCIKCGNTNPNLDSDDMVPCWMVRCDNPECNQKASDREMTYGGAITEWNKLNTVKQTIK